MLVGLISDTHGKFDPQIPELFRDVEHILHAGDICGNEIIRKLERIAPVTAVLGNNDYDPQYREKEIVELAGTKILIHHIVPFHNPRAPIFDSIERVKPDLVLYGHTHKPADETRDGIRYLNPGSAGPKRFNLPRTVALLDLSTSPAMVDFHDL
ncbi:MAG: metallophosphoesterase family protein [Limisphaerales bacterium]